MQIPSDLLISIKDVNCTLCRLYKITLFNNDILYLTDADIDVKLNNEVFKKTNGISSSATSSSSAMNVSTFQITGYTDEDTFKTIDLRSGLFSGADVLVMMCNYEHPEYGYASIENGVVGDVTIENQKFTLEIRTLTNQIQQNVGRKHMASCDTDLFSSICGVIKSDFTFNGTVTEVSDLISITDSNLTQPDGFFDYGLIVFTSGLNKFYSKDIKSFVGGKVTFQLPFYKEIKVGDTFEISAGCDKTLDTCITKFNNVVNFQGFPDIPNPEITVGGGS